MTKRLTILLAALAVLGFVVAGCGDDEGDGTTEANTSADTVTTDRTAPQSEGKGEKASKKKQGKAKAKAKPAPAETGDDDGGGDAAPPSLQEALERCRENVSKAEGLSEETRANLLAVCESAGSGAPSEEELRESVRKICEQFRDNADSPMAKQVLERCGQR